MPSPSLKDIYDAINDFRDEVRGTYATKEEVCGVKKEFNARLAPVQAIAFTLVGTIALAVLYAVLATVVKAQ